jgi:hypothetical protein
MHRSKNPLIRSLLVFGFSLAIFGLAAHGAQTNVPTDVSKIRGFNYESADTIGLNEMWLQYNPAETSRDMDYAKRLNLNQVRVFLGYTAWTRDKAAFSADLRDFIRTCQKRGIGVMATLQYPKGWAEDQSKWPLAEAMPPASSAASATAKSRA